jgi:hypothetical protein
MAIHSKIIFSLLTALLAASFTVSVNPVLAQSTPTPSTPQFSINTGVAYNDVPTEYYLDSNSGEIAAKLGYHEEYTTITLTVTNQNFEPTGSFSMFYNVRIHYVAGVNGDWSEVYNANMPIYPSASSGSSTSFTLPNHYNETIEIQVQAMIGYLNRASLQFASGDKFYGQTSDWSQSQTATPRDIITSLSPTPNPSSQGSTLTSTAAPTEIPEDNNAPAISFLLAVNAVELAIIVLLLAVVSILLIKLRKKSKKQ